VPLAFAVPILFMACALQFHIQCRVCGLRLRSSSACRRLPRSARSRWLKTLGACPICGDDGRATAQSRETWIRSGRLPEEVYWSMTRLGVAVLAILAMLIVLFMIPWRTGP
jgi:hypothetical protein